MKLSKILTIGVSAHAWSPFDPAYDRMADVVLIGTGQVTSVFERVQGQLHEDAKATPDFDELITTLAAIENTDIVRVLKNIASKLIWNQRLTPNDLVEIFTDELNNPDSPFYGIDFKKIAEELTTNLDEAQLELLTNAALAITDFIAVLKDIYNDKINFHNIAGAARNIMDAAITFNDIYNFIDTETLTERIQYSSMIVRKILFVWEKWNEYLNMYKDAAQDTSTEYNRRIVDIQEQFCNGNLGFIEASQKKLKFVPEIIIDNWYTPVKKNTDIFNKVVDKVPGVDNFADSDNILQNLITILDEATVIVDGALTELDDLTNHFAPQINIAARGYFCEDERCYESILCSVASAIFIENTD